MDHKKVIKLQKGIARNIKHRDALAKIDRFDFDKQGDKYINVWADNEADNLKPSDDKNIRDAIFDYLHDHSGHIAEQAKSYLAKSQKDMEKQLKDAVNS